MRPPQWVRSLRWGRPGRRRGSREKSSGDGGCSGCNRAGSAGRSACRSEGPLVGAPEAAELPNRQGEKRSHEQQPQPEGPAFSPLAGLLPAGLGLGLELAQLALGTADPALQVAELLFQPLSFTTEPPLLVELGVELAHPGDHLRVLTQLVGGPASLCGKVVREGRQPGV